MWIYSNTNGLSHHGIKGMKWGVRRSEKQLARLRGKAEKENWSDDAKTASEIKMKSAKQMSNAELKKLNERLRLEKEHAQLTQKSSKGKKWVKGYIAAAGTLTGLIAATATYKKWADKGLDKVGDWVIKDLKPITRFDELTP